MTIDFPQAAGYVAGTSDTADPRRVVGNLTSLFQAAVKANQSEIFTAMPAIITAFDAVKHTCSCQPAIRAVVRNAQNEQTQVNLPILQDVPIQIYAAGNHAITLPVKVGDECLLVFAQRCIDLWWSHGGTQEQAEYRMHDPSDGFAILGFRSQVRLIEDYNTENIEIRDLERENYVEIQPEQVFVKGNNVGVDTAGRVTVNARGGITLTGNVNITGTLDVGGALDVGGDAHFDSNVVIEGHETVGGGSSHAHN